MSHDNNKPVADAINELEERLTGALRVRQAARLAVAFKELDALVGRADELCARQVGRLADASKELDALREWLTRALRERQATRPADPNTAPLQRKLDEAHQAPLSDEAPKPTPTRKRKPSVAGIPRQAALPLAPRLICREDAAAYASVSPNTFDTMVADGRMPNPRRLTDRRLGWDVRQLDAAIDLLPIDGDAETDTETTDHSWDDIDAQAKTKPSVR